MPPSIPPTTDGIVVPSLARLDHQQRFFQSFQNFYSSARYSEMFNSMTLSSTFIFKTSTYFVHAPLGLDSVYIFATSVGLLQMHLYVIETFFHTRNCSGRNVMNVLCIYIHRRFLHVCQTSLHSTSHVAVQQH